jgi:hypothetical protein
MNMMGFNQIQEASNIAGQTGMKAMFQQMPILRRIRDMDAGMIRKHGLEEELESHHRPRLRRASLLALPSLGRVRRGLPHRPLSVRAQRRQRPRHGGRRDAHDLGLQVRQRVHAGMGRSRGCAEVREPRRQPDEGEPEAHGLARPRRRATRQGPRPESSSTPQSRTARSSAAS